MGQTTQGKGLLLLNPVINRQFLTLLKYVQRLVYIAEVPNKTPTTIHIIYRSGKIENKGNVRFSDYVFAIYLVIDISQVLKLIKIPLHIVFYCCIHPVTFRPLLGSKTAQSSVLHFKTSKKDYQQEADLEPGVKTSRVRSSLDNEDQVPIYQVVTAIRDIKGNVFKEDNFRSFFCSWCSDSTATVGTRRDTVP